jgi:hypothetical protein
LPALGGFVAGQASAGEEIQRMARLAEAQALYRDTVEVVSAAKDTVAIEPLRPEPERDPRGRKRPRRGRERFEEPESSQGPSELFLVEPVVDTRV